jgi:plasmid stabilization system protein ParE
MYRFIIKERAVLMAKDAYEWYEEQLPGLGGDFLLELELGYTKILENPTFYSFIENGFRRLLLKRFPYVIIYEILDTDLVVYAVFHTSRNPNSRLKD